MQMKLPSISTQIVVLSVMALVAFAFWDTIFIYPIKLFVVLLHEMSHGLAAILTGGSIDHIEISEQVGGVCWTSGGWRFAVASAGYLGSILWGGVILIAATRGKSAQAVAGIIAIIVLALTIVYVRNTFGVIFGLIFGIGMIALAKFASTTITQYVLKFLGTVSCLYALVDIKEDLFTLQHRGSDADALAELTGIPALLWGILWLVIAVVAFWKFVKIAARTSTTTQAME
jgi:hypothetical protein